MTDSTKKPKNQGCLIGCGTIFLLIAMVTVMGAISSFQEENLDPEQKAQKEQKKVNDWFITGAQYSCEDDLKEKLRDPKSYERDEEFTTLEDSGNKKVITWEFRSKNGFGGYNNGVGICSVSKENGGTVKTEMIDQ